MTSTDAVSIVQLSDTHFLERGAAPEGLGAYDTAAAFDAVFEHLGHHHHHDMVVVTGDVADHGRPEQYRVAAEALSRFEIPVLVTPGNHDQDVPFAAGIGRAGVATTRVVEVGAWAFLFVDSNAGIMVDDASGRRRDPEVYEDRLHGDGSLGERESTWVRDMCGSVDAEHVFVWVHHPPGFDVPMLHAPDYSAEWAAVLADAPCIRGIGAGHTHIPDVYGFEGRSVHVAPSLKNSFDYRNETWLPPGYRTFRFEADGTVSSEVHLVDDERWPRRPMGRAIKALFDGELTFEQLAEIAARRASRT